MFIVISALAVHIIMNGLSNLRAVGSQHMTSHIWDGPQHHVTTLMLRKFAELCVLIVVYSAGNSRRVQHIDRIMP
jgi:hypothetical protein